jgi:hypothetical protein
MIGLHHLPGHPGDQQRCASLSGITTALLILVTLLEPYKWNISAVEWLQSLPAAGRQYR